MNTSTPTQVMNKVRNGSGGSGNNRSYTKSSPVKFNQRQYYSNGYSNGYYAKSESTSPSNQRQSPFKQQQRSYSYSWSNSNQITPNKSKTTTPIQQDSSTIVVPNPFSLSKGYNDPPPADILPLPPVQWTKTPQTQPTQTESTYLQSICKSQLQTTISNALNAYTAVSVRA